MWFGNGKPGVTTRVEILEKGTVVMATEMTEMKSTLKGINTRFWTIVALLIGAIVSTATDIVIHAHAQEPGQANHSYLY